MILLIDGYNLLFTQPLPRNNRDSVATSHARAGFTPPDELETLRENLVLQLKSYNTRKKHRIIVVFDGDKTVSHYPQEKESGNVRVVFSQGQTTADEHIINLVASYMRDKPRRSDVCAVTSDRALAETLKSNRVRIISSEEFAAELTVRNSSAAPELKDEPIEKFTGLKPSDVPKWLKIFGTTDDTDSAD